jgi:hypothetical protein
MMTEQYDYEKLGLFYLGRECDLATLEPEAVPMLYQNKYLTTHAAIIGMTGSGKTGLGIGLIEEAIIDHIPAIIIDPKGDMGNLMLTFPDLTAKEFEPWVDSSEAARKGMEVAQYAQYVADTWSEGLKSWGQDKSRIKMLQDRADITLYTPGSSAGVSISVLSGFHAPAPEIIDDTDTLNGLVNATTDSLLALIDIRGEALQSKEHILVSSILIHFWRKQEDLTIEALIGHIVNPPFTKVGVFALDTFYPQNERMELAMRLNNVLASPAFSSWIAGQPFDVGRMLYSEKGRPKVAIFALSHLSETERMFFVTMLLNRFISWMRRQQGTSSLKALLYMDEIFGYFPPTANPPSKKPMLLLLKQARAYGVGVVLATQNPVDLDYKGLSNIGTWFIGRLQTKQDRGRVIDGIVEASEGRLDRNQVDKLLGNIPGRTFFMNCVHMDRSLLFQTRWVLSYLKGPISNRDIKKLSAARTQTAPLPDTLSYAASVSKPPEMRSEPGAVSHPPMLSNQIEQYFVLKPTPAEAIVFEPWLAAEATVRFCDTRRNIDITQGHRIRIYLDEGRLDPEWEKADANPYTSDEYTLQAPTNSAFFPLPADFSQLRSLRQLTKDYSDYLYQTQRYELFSAKDLKLESQPGEILGDFRVRLADVLREKRDEAVEDLRNKYRTKQAQLQRRLEAAYAKIEKEKADVKAKTTDTVLSVGMAFMGALFGKKALSVSTASRAVTGLRSAGRIAKEKGDVQRAQEQMARIQRDMERMAAEIEERVADIAKTYDPINYEVESFFIKPRRSDIYDLSLYLLWEASDR